MQQWQGLTWKAFWCFCNGVPIPNYFPLTFQRQIINRKEMKINENFQSFNSGWRNVFLSTTLALCSFPKEHGTVDFQAQILLIFTKPLVRVSSFLLPIDGAVLSRICIFFSPIVFFVCFYLFFLPSSVSLSSTHPTFFLSVSLFLSFSFSFFLS